MNQVLLYYPRVSGEEDTSDLYMGAPLSVMTIAAQIDQSEYDIKIVDGRFYQEVESNIDNWITDEILVVGISAITSYQITDGIQLARRLRERYPHIRIVWGGWHPSLMPDTTIEHEMVDTIILGQGERVFPMLLNCIRDKGDINDIPNLVYKDDQNQVIKTKRVEIEPVANFKGIIHSYNLVDLNRYVNKVWGNERIIGYESSRGCPWSCRYCSISSLYCHHWSALPAEQVVAEVKHLYENYHVDAIHFFDNNFFVDSKRVEKICELIQEEDMKIRWDGTCNVKQFLGFSDEFMQQMIKTGFYRVIIGIESGDEEVLEKIDKKHNNEQVIKVIEKCKKYGIMPSLSFMVGFPWNPEKDFEETVSLIQKIKQMYSRSEILLFIFTPYCGTKMYDVAKEYGMTFPEELEEWSRYTYDRCNTPWISKKLRRKMLRYITFFGTKDMDDNLKLFYEGKTENELENDRK